MVDAVCRLLRHNFSLSLKTKQGSKVSAHQGAESNLGGKPGDRHQTKFAWAAGKVRGQPRKVRKLRWGQKASLGSDL